MAKQNSQARGQMQPFSKSDVAVIREKLAARGNLRDLALFETAISSMLRASDLVRLTVADVTDREGSVVAVISVGQQKTGRSVAVHLSASARVALARLIADDRLTPQAFLFCRDDRAAGAAKTAISTTTYRTLIKKFADLAGYTDVRRFSGHSTRRTKATIIYRETRDIEGVRKLLGHTSLAHTAVYLGVGAEEALALAARIEV